MLLVVSRIVLHLSPANGLQSWTIRLRPWRSTRDDHVPVGPQTNGMSSGSGMPSPLRSPTTHWYMIVRPDVATCGAFAIATVRAIALAMFACAEPCTGRSCAPASEPKSTAFCRTWRSWYRRLMSITNATAAKRITMVSAAKTAMAPCSSFSRSLMMVLPSPGVGVISPSNLDSDCEWSIQRRAQTRNEGTDRRDHVVR